MTFGPLHLDVQNQYCQIAGEPLSWSFMFFSKRFMRLWQPTRSSKFGYWIRITLVNQSVVRRKSHRFFEFFL